MARDVAPRPRAQIELRQSAVEKSREPLQACPRGRAAIGALTEHDGKDIRDRALLDDDPAIHVGFAESQLRINKNATLGRPRGETYRHRRAGAVSEGKSRSTCGGDPEIPNADQTLQRPSKQPIHRPPPTASSVRHATSSTQLTSTGVGQRPVPSTAAAMGTPAN